MSLLQTAEIAALCYTHERHSEVREVERVWRDDLDAICNEGSSWVELTDEGWIVPGHWVAVLRRWYDQNFAVATYDDFHTYITRQCMCNQERDIELTAVRVAHRLLHGLVPMAVVYMIASNRNIVYVDNTLDGPYVSGERPITSKAVSFP